LKTSAFDVMCGRSAYLFTAITRASNGAKESMIAVKAKTAKP
jgi:hypothetical protein